MSLIITGVLIVPRTLWFLDIFLGLKIAISHLYLNLIQIQTE